MKNYTSIFQIFILLAVISFTNEVKAQIIYTNIPDSTISRTTTNPGTLTNSIDINNDLSNDYNLAVRAQIVIPAGCTIIPSFKTNLFAWIGTTPSFSNSIGDSAGFTANILPDSTIGATVPFTWNNSQQNYLYNKSFSYPSCIWDSTIQGFWGDSVSGYVALKMKLGAQIHYGWIHLIIVIGTDSLGDPMISATVTDFAYNSIPDQLILAGDTGFVSGVNEFKKDDKLNFSIFPNPVSDEFFVKSFYPGNFRFEILNLQGKVVFSENALGLINKFDVPDLSPGLYFYRFSYGENQYSSGKLIKE